MSWNHRVFKHKHVEPDGREYFSYGIHEAYYLDRTRADVVSNYTPEAERVEGDSLEDLKWTLESMLKALNKPVLDYETEK